MRLLSSLRQINKCTRGIGGFIGKQPQDGVNHFCRLAVAFHRHNVLEPLFPVRIAATGMNVGVNDPRPNRVHSDAFRRHFLGQADGHRIQRAFRSLVIDIFTRRS